MSRHDYEVSKQIVAEDPPFPALVMAAYRRADSFNALLLKAGFPEIIEELQSRYHAPGGVLPDD